MRGFQGITRVCFGLAVLFGATVPAVSGVHLWRITEAFSNADGTVQFIEIAACCGSTAENCLSCGNLSSGSGSVTFTNVSGSTLNKRVLIATSGFAALPGAPTPDFTMPANFISLAGDTLAFSVYDAWVIGAGELPTDGTTSLNKLPDDTDPDTPFTAQNSPTNYAGVTGSVNASPGPPGVPDGTGGTTPMTASLTVPDGSSLSVSFDTASCSGGTQHHILYGQRSGFPTTPGGTFTLLGSVCSIGNTSPFAWTSVPSPAVGNLLWFLLVVTDSGGIEGSWGEDRAGNERTGTGNNGASGCCALVKNVTNACGH